ncbi:hypothetical protein HDU87_004196 [Geranomyces variabilis]|uniref:Uncharacterized protein n=1 Tax=Geranomyces variabilis TaxID=109894 RepID=A0AAD5XM69_9FUNG|nr:hypothetical protein HDU87_004196 [Geranomyces variabilis]
MRRGTLLKLAALSQAVAIYPSSAATLTSRAAVGSLDDVCTVAYAKGTLSESPSTPPPSPPTPSKTTPCKTTTTIPPRHSISAT